MGIRGIGGIFFKAKDPEALAAWYERHLGVKRDEEGYTVLGWRELDHPERVGETVWSPFPEDTKYFEPSKASWMLNFRVDDLDGTLARLRTEGVDVVGEPESFEYGKFGWVLDCEGNKVELWEPPEEHAFDVTVPDTTSGRPGEWLCEPGSSIATDAAGMDPRRIVKETTVSLPRSEVWRLWTTAEGIRSWLVQDCDVDLRIGGPYEFYFDMDQPVGLKGGEGCKILSFLPNEMLSFTWNAPPQLDYTRTRFTHVVLELESSADRQTTIRLTHLGWPTTARDSHPQWPETYEYFDRAWGQVMEAFSRFAKIMAE